jgi:hypothetical protein
MTEETWVAAKARQAVDAGATGPHDAWTWLDAARQADDVPVSWAFHAHLAVGDLLHAPPTPKDPES